MNKKKIISIVLTGAFLAGGMGSTFANTEIPEPEIIPISAPINEVILAPSPIIANYTDIEEHWAYKDIITMVEKGVMQGENGQFQPEKIVNPEEFINCLEKIFEEYTLPELNLEKDLEYITRIEVAKAIEKTFVDNKISVAMTLVFPVYEDTMDISPQESSALSFVFNTGIMKGKTEGKFHPNDSLTKAELAAVLNRTLGTLELAQPQAEVEKEVKEDVIITMNGLVSEVNFDENNKIENILVENSSEDNMPFDKAYFLVNENTKILQGENGVTEIKEGQNVSVEYVDGPITKIYPARIGAKLIKILE